MQFSESSKLHISHLADLQRMLFSSASREYSIGDEPVGFLEYWDPHFAGLYLISVYIYINEQAESEKIWNSSAKFDNKPELARCLEALRLIRNVIVHNGGLVPQAALNDNGDPNTGKVIRDFESDVAAGSVFVDWTGKPIKIRSFFKIEQNDKVQMLRDMTMIRFLAIAPLEAEELIQLQ